jgi:hypothetical protein
MFAIFRKDPCGKKMYDPKTEVCCDGEPHPFHGGSAENTRCCGDAAYSIKDDFCCNGEVNISFAFLKQNKF